FYVWKDGKAVKKTPGTPPSGLSERLIAPLVERTRAQVEHGVVADADLADAGVVLGTGFAPFSGGPLHRERHRAPPVHPICRDTIRQSHNNMEIGGGMNPVWHQQYPPGIPTDIRGQLKE